MARDIVDLYSLTVQDIDDDINNYSFTITGDGGVGKSTFANALFNRLGSSVTFAFEDRFRGIPNLKKVDVYKSGWDVMDSYISMIRKGLREDKPLPFKHIIFDPIGRAGKMCEDYVCEENGWDSIGQPGYGAGYLAFEKEFSDKVEQLRSMGIKVDFVAHGKSETITPPRQEGYNVQMPDIQNKLKYLVKDEVDFLLYLAKVRVVDESGNPKAVRRLYLQGYPEYSLKVPLDGFPEYIEWSGDVEEGVDKFLAAFDKAVEITRAKQSGETGENPVVHEDDESDLVDLRVKIEIIRDDLINSGIEKIEVAKLLRDALGTAKVTEMTDVAKMKAFIKDHS